MISSVQRMQSRDYVCFKAEAEAEAEAEARGDNLAARQQNT